MLSSRFQHRSEKGSRRASARSSPRRTKHLLVDFRSGEAVDRHPDVKRLLQRGWNILHARPRTGGAGRIKLYVEMERPTTRPRRLIPT